MAEVVLGDVIESLQLAGQPAAVQGTVANKRDAELAACVDDAATVQRVPREQTQLDLDGSGWVHGVGTTDGLGIHLTQTVGPNLARLDQFYERLDTGLNGHIGVDTRRLEEVDGLEAIKYSQTFVYGGSDVFWTGLWRLCGAIIGPFDTKYDARGIFRVLGKIVLEELERIGVWRAVESSLSRKSADDV